MASLEALTELLSALEDNHSMREAPDIINVHDGTTRKTNEQEYDGVAAAAADTGGRDGKSGIGTQVHVEKIDLSELSPATPRPNVRDLYKLKCTWIFTQVLQNKT